MRYAVIAMGMFPVYLAAVLATLNERRGQTEDRPVRRPASRCAAQPQGTDPRWWTRK